MNHTRLVTIITAISILFLFACSNENTNGLQIKIKHVVQGKEVQIEDATYATAAGHDYKIFRLKYYLSNFLLESEDGSSFFIDTVQLFDILEADKSTFNIAEIPPANYTKLSFVFGLNKEKNVEGGLENTMDNNSMEWPVIGEKGYHYMKFEGKYDSLQTGVWKNFNLHTGPTENNANFAKITLDLPQTKAEQTNLIINLEMDLHRLLHGPNNYDFVEFGQGIMANQNAQKILQQNMGDVFQIIQNPLSE